MSVESDNLELDRYSNSAESRLQNDNERSRSPNENYNPLEDYT